MTRTSGNLSTNDALVIAARTAAIEAANAAEATSRELERFTQVFRIARSLLVPDECLVTDDVSHRLIESLQNENGQLTGWRAMKGDSLHPVTISDDRANILAAEHASLRGYDAFLDSVNGRNLSDDATSAEVFTLLRRVWADMPLVERHDWIVNALGDRLDAYKTSPLAIPESAERLAAINALMIAHLPGLGLKVLGHRFIERRPDETWSVEVEEDGKTTDCAVSQAEAFTLCLEFVSKRARELYWESRTDVAPDDDKDEDWRQLPLADREEWISRALYVVRKEALVSAAAANKPGRRSDRDKFGY